MRFLVQRVSEANVMVDNNITGKIGKGYLILIRITHTDTTDDADYLMSKIKPDCKVKNIMVTEAGCVISTHCGPRCIGILYIVNE